MKSRYEDIGLDVREVMFDDIKYTRYDFNGYLIQWYKLNANKPFTGTYSAMYAMADRVSGEDCDILEKRYQLMLVKRDRKNKVQKICS